MRSSRPGAPRARATEGDLHGLHRQRRQGRDHAARHAVPRRRVARPGVGRAAHRLAARARDARDLRRRLDGRADLADGRRAHRGHADGGRGDRRARPVPPRHRHRAARRDVRAHRRGAVARRAGRARRRAVLRAPDPAGPVRLVQPRSRPSSRTCRSSSTTCRSGRRWTSRRRRSGGCAARTRTSSGSRRPRATSSTSPTCSTSAAPTSSRSRGSSCSATRCSRWAATATCRCVANFAPEPAAQLYDTFIAGRPETRAAAALRAARARRRRVRGDEPGAGEVDHAPDGDPAVGVRARAARAAERGRAVARAGAAWRGRLGCGRSWRPEWSSARRGRLRLAAWPELLTEGGPEWAAARPVVAASAARPPRWAVRARPR